MSESPDPAAEVVSPVVETEIPAPEPAEAAPAAEPAEGDAPPAAEAPEGQAEPEEPRKPKSPVAQLQGRVGHLTKSLHQRDADLAERDKQITAYKALLEGQGKPADPEAPPALAPPPANPADFQAAVQAEARRIAAGEKFNADSNAIFDAGLKAHGNEFKEAVTNLNLLGLMNDQLIEAALATDAPADVIHFLGTDTEEAERITALPPIRMAAEMTKLATKLSGTKEALAISRAPAPIRPLGGAAKPEIDISDPNLSMPEYVARRKAQGSRWAR